MDHPFYYEDRTAKLMQHVMILGSLPVRCAKKCDHRISFSEESGGFSATTVHTILGPFYRKGGRLFLAFLKNKVYVTTNFAPVYDPSLRTYYKQNKL